MVVFGTNDGRLVMSFNTASGKYYCNLESRKLRREKGMMVSIPQAVSTIAID